MARYSPEDKIRAIEALRASAEVVEGELVPQFHALAQVAGMPTYITLRKWWDARDKGEDYKRLQDIQRARESEAGRGAEDWLRRQHEGVRDVVEYILDPIHRTGDSPAPPHHMALALKHTWPLLTDLDNALNGRNTNDRSGRLARLKTAARRLGLSKPKGVKK